MKHPAWQPATHRDPPPPEPGSLDEPIPFTREPVGLDVRTVAPSELTEAERAAFGMA